MHEQLTETSLMQSADGFFASCSVNPQYRLLTTPIVFLGFTALFSLAMLSLNGENLTVINGHNILNSSACLLNLLQILSFIHNAICQNHQVSILSLFSSYLFLSLNLLYLDPNLT